MSGRYDESELRCMAEDGYMSASLDKPFGTHGPSLEELAMADTRSNRALIMYVNPESRIPLCIQKTALWIKRHILRRTLI